MAEQIEIAQCPEVYPPLLEVAGVRVQCEREAGHSRRLWHRVTNENDQRTEWQLPEGRSVT